MEQLTQEQERFAAILKSTISSLCKNGMINSQVARIEGLLGVTLSNNTVFLVNIKEQLCEVVAKKQTTRVNDKSAKRIVSSSSKVISLVEENSDETVGSDGQGNDNSKIEKIKLNSQVSTDDNRLSSIKKNFVMGLRSRLCSSANKRKRIAANFNGTQRQKNLRSGPVGNLQMFCEDIPGYSNEMAEHNSLYISHEGVSSEDDNEEREKKVKKERRSDDDESTDDNMIEIYQSHFPTLQLNNGLQTEEQRLPSLPTMHIASEEESMSTRKERARQRTESNCKPGTYKQYDEKCLELALDAVSSGTLRAAEAAKIFGVPYSTVRYAIKRRQGQQQNIQTTP